MKATLRGVSGPGAGSQVDVEDGMIVSIGRNASCTLSIAQDRLLSSVHFEIGVSGEKVIVRDRNSTNGTFVNGVRCREFELGNGDLVQAGETVYKVRLDMIATPSVLDFLSNQPHPLYAVLDSARDPEIYSLLMASGAQHWSLYAGDSARKLETVAPYLVYLPVGSGILQTIIEKGWGKSWGMFLTSSQAPQMIWHELRRSLMVMLEETGKLVYFRFYDPRVLRVFLPIADAKQRADFAGTITNCFVEDEDPAILLRFYSFSTGLAIDKVVVRFPVAMSPVQTIPDILAVTIPG